MVKGRGAKGRAGTCVSTLIITNPYVSQASNRGVKRAQSVKRPKRTDCQLLRCTSEVYPLPLKPQ
jgi:hypothetical protein